MARQTLLERYLDELDRQLGPLPEAARGEVREEVQQHLQSLAQAHEELGSEPDAAMAAALRQFGDATRIGRAVRREKTALPTGAVIGRAAWLGLKVSAGIYGGPYLGMLGIAAVYHILSGRCLGLTEGVIALCGLSGLAVGVLAALRNPRVWSAAGVYAGMVLAMCGTNLFGHWAPDGTYVTAGVTGAHLSAVAGRAGQDTLLNTLAALLYTVPVGSVLWARQKTPRGWAAMGAALCNLLVLTGLLWLSALSGVLGNGRPLLQALGAWPDLNVLAVSCAHAGVVGALLASGRDHAGDLIDRCRRLFAKRTPAPPESVIARQG